MLVAALSTPFIFQVEDLQRKLECANKEQEALIDIFSEERARRDLEEDGLRNKLKHLFLADPNNLFNLFPLWQEASATIQDLLEQLNTAKKGRKV
ncbi:hypothetical protein HU200_042357 [Digitaria exilis]|uniref:Uncharacterized protein n=1 Tax=Digitaria exilis TaxID=1010633 RepID=A0A835EIE5_9POAL|nr:hypothetical protein HU200_042357 [Digitaria exilis]